MFAETYFEARERFRAAAVRIGARVHSFTHETAFGPGGESLTCDMVRLGDPDARSIFFTVCGVHGVESYPGSAAQVDLLESGQLEDLPEGVAAVLVHGLNPWGWSRDTQRNEDLIDINRNFVRFDSALPKINEIHLAIRDAVRTDEISYDALTDATRRLWSLKTLYPIADLMSAMGGGQYELADSMKFGGFEPCWSNRLYRRIVSEHLAAAKRLAVIDWHTGLGEYGDVFPLCFADAGSEAMRRTRAWWGAEAVDRGTKSWATAGDDHPAPDLSGVAHMALVEMAPHADIAGGVIEFGTVPVPDIVRAALLDHWITVMAPDGFDDRRWRAQLRAWFAPRDPVWESAALTHARRLNTATLSGLIAWDRDETNGAAAPAAKAAGQ